MLLGVLSFVIIDLILLLLNITIGEALGTSEAVIVPNKDNPHTITGVRIIPNKSSSARMIQFHIIYRNYKLQLIT